MKDQLEFDITPQAFLERAKSEIRRFDQGHTSSLFYAALELRMGIEARLHEYIGDTCQRLKLDPAPILRNHSATKLLNKLTCLNPDAQRMTLKVTSSKSEYYSPVTRDLTKMHGRLGEVLHYTVFSKNEHWRSYLPWDGKKSLHDFRDFLKEVEWELGEAVMGNLLAPAIFDETIKKLGEEAAEGPDA